MKPPRATRYPIHPRSLLVILAVWSMVGGRGVSVLADEGRAEHYARHVKPLLRERCYACHGALKQESGLRLDTGEAILRGGDSGPVVQAGEPDGSYLLSRITADDPLERMPPEGQPLAADEIEAVRQWIAKGAIGPDDEAPEQDPRDHWAFQPPRRPAASRWLTTSSGHNPIDDLIHIARAGKQLQPTALASRPFLLRRLYLDLVGLPPTVEELEAFRCDNRPDAYERVVDRLLSSPLYGQRWARHWMDVWRYTDWYGLDAQLRHSQKHLWHWRDWIVESLNADMGYDQMIMQMLAGDEIAPTDHSTLRATGFLARNYYLFNRTTWLDETIEHTSKAFLGLTINCSKCHDHKYDPLSHHDYYALRAIFEPHQVRLDVVPGQTDLELDGIARAFDAHPDAPTYIHIRGDEKQPNTEQAIEPAIPRFLAHIPFAPQAIKLPLAAVRPELQAFVWRDQLQSATDQARAAQQRLDELRQAERSPTAEDNLDSAESEAYRAAERQAAETRLRAASLRVVLLAEMQAAELAKCQDESAAEATIRQAALTARRWELAAAQCQLAEAQRQQQQPNPPANAEQQVKDATKRVEDCERALDKPGTNYPLPRASIKALEGPDETEASRFAAYSASSTGRRLALAKWIVHPLNPLTARVAANHIWLRHFGQPLVDPVDDFGRRTPRPPQQALLDWLAVEFIDSGWQMKHLHRLIVCSQTYRLAGSDATTDPAMLAADGENHFYWHRQAIRMQSEVIRDSLLHLAGELDVTLGGPTIDPRRDELPYRRSLYFTHSRDDQHPLLAMFDDPDILRCYRRQESVVPQQALALANSRQALFVSEQIARRIQLREVDDRQAPLQGSATRVITDREFIERAFVTLLCRPPGEPEREACLLALDQWRQLDNGQAAERARANLIHALLNHNDFVTIR